MPKGFVENFQFFFLQWLVPSLLFFINMLVLNVIVIATLYSLPCLSLVLLMLMLEIGIKSCSAHREENEHFFVVFVKFQTVPFKPSADCHRFPCLGNEISAGWCE